MTGGDGAGLRFYKLTGSGNDFVFFDVRRGRPPFAGDPAAIAALCARGEGVGADGVVFLGAPAAGQVEIVYLNSDGSRAALCGNATLCTARLAVHLDIAAIGEPFHIRTDSGALRAVVGHGGEPSFELAPVRDLEPDAVDAAAGVGEQRVGYALAGVPHLVVRVDDVSAADVVARGRELRAATPSRPGGANVNFVGRGPDGAWRMRTFERGVEGETLACGTGAVAVATVLRAWAEAGDAAQIVTRSGRSVTVTQPRAGADGPTLAGEGRLVYEGTLQDWR